MSNRDWVYVLIISTLVQAGVWFLSYHYSDENNVLNYISFSGTLISIILAVLAIGYTYGESILQKNSNDALSDQIKSLRKIKDKIQIQADALDDIKTLKNELFVFSAKVDHSFNLTQQRIEDFKEEFKNNVVKDYELIEFSEDNQIEIINKIFGNASRFNKLILLILLSYFDSGESDITKLIKEFIKNIDPSYEDYSVLDSLFGGFVQLGDILESFKLLNNDSDSRFIHPKLIELFNDYVKSSGEELGGSFNGFGNSILSLAKRASFYNINH